jgi:hypothetical protein
MAAIWRSPTRSRPRDVAVAQVIVQRGLYVRPASHQCSAVYLDRILLIPTVSLTTFVDFVAATGTTRITRVRSAKTYYEQGYAPERDFYKPLRDRIEAAPAG